MTGERTHRDVGRTEVAQDAPPAAVRLVGTLADDAPAPVITADTAPRFAGTGRIRRAPDRRAAPPRDGLPDGLRLGLEALSGMAMDDVRVHYDSPMPAQLDALAYAQGTDIHLGPGQEQHLPHEAWHVVQQAQGRVRPTMQLKGAQIADTDSLEREADTMGARALAGAAAPARLRPIARRSAVPMQMRWGAYDGANREDARQILINRNRSNEVQTGLGGVLEEMLHFKDAALADIDDALRQMPADFTSAVRGKSITVALRDGLPLAYVQIAVQACPADDGTLQPLIDLLVVFDQSGMAAPDLAHAQLYSQLLGAGQPSQAIVDAAMRHVNLLTTVAMATAIIAHHQAGGTSQEVNLAALVAPDDDHAAFNNVLAALVAMRTIVGFAALSGAAKRAVLGERAGLTSDVLRTNAVATAGAAEDGQAAAELARTRSFGYREDFTEHATAKAAEHRSAVEETAKDEVTEQAEKDKAKAFTDQRSAAEGSLTRNQEKALKFPNSDKGKEALAAVDTNQTKLAAPKVKEIEDEAATKITEIETVTGPQAEEERSAEYSQWFASVNHHPNALEALEAADEDFTLATSIVAMIVADDTTRVMLTGSGLNTDQIEALLTLTTVPLATLINGGVTAADFIAYAAKTNRMALLRALVAANVPIANVRSLVPCLGGLAPTIGNGPECAHLVTLLATTTGPEVVALRDACPAAVGAKMALLVAVRPKAASAANLTTVLTWCTAAMWSEALITATFNPLAIGRSLAQMRDAVYAAELARYDKLNAFASWLHSLDRLIHAGYLEVVQIGDWHRLQFPPPTDELDYDVQVAATHTYVESFCVHFHPGAQPAGINNPNASKSHLKPQRGGNVRYLSPMTLTHLAPHLQMRP